MAERYAPHLNVIVPLLVTTSARNSSPLMFILPVPALVNGRAVSI